MVKQNMLYGLIQSILKIRTLIVIVAKSSLFWFDILTTNRILVNVSSCYSSYFRKFFYKRFLFSVSQLIGNVIKYIHTTCRACVNGLNYLHTGILLLYQSKETQKYQKGPKDQDWCYDQFAVLRVTAPSHHRPSHPPSPLQLTDYDFKVGKGSIQLLATIDFKLICKNYINILPNAH